jgi:succinate dehydrogenase / fumarate reductase, membrane anchor subunit
MSLTSPLGRVLGLGSAKEGSRHWYAQRLSAIAQALLGIWFVVALAGLDGVDLDRVRTWLSAPLTTTLLLLMIGTLAWHTILGLQVVIEDYVGSRGLRVALLIAMKFGFVLAAVAGAIAVLRLAVGVPA